ncbi:GTP cyclohydrolase I [Kribbella sp. NPDC059898]|uniref:GTP cyclohydrolase I n=1 Tax=Kribbella sp. NPDC059898 TaxID=3346995 RepID=UPI0036684DBC
MTALHLSGPSEEAPHAPISADQGVDLTAATTAAAGFLSALGFDLDQGGLADTPGRMARAYAEMFTPRPFNFTVFENDEEYRELVIERAIPFASVCEHHGLPFIGTADVGYLPGKKILGLSKMARVVELFSCRPQVQERLTMQVARFLEERLSPQGVGVVMRAEHMCMRLRGARVAGAETVTSEVRGVLRKDASARQEFMALTGSTR